ncbi:hypothetical protein [Pantoea stewartii]|uniref:hypothetical protein n=1 Tax=Pantoea stewartii TaxID=66269 RepID=UPI00197F9600|nr:hypothetical protein [Pantoea stewartii]
MISTKKIDAICVNCSDEDDVLTLAVGDDNSDPKKFFIIGRFDEDNLSVDECIGFQNESTQYEIPSAIEYVELNDKALVVTINDMASNEAGAKSFHAIFKTTIDKTKINQFLHAIFKDSSTKLNIN